MAFIDHCVLQIQSVFQKFAASPTLKAGSSKNNILRVGWGLKEMSEGQLALRNIEPIGPTGLVSLLPQNTFATQTIEGVIVELSKAPGITVGCHEGSAPCAFS